MNESNEPLHHLQGRQSLASVLGAPAHLADPHLAAQQTSRSVHACIGVHTCTLPVESGTGKQCLLLLFYLSFFFPCLQTAEAAGTSAAFIFRCSFFSSSSSPPRSDVSRGLPQLFYQVILSGRQPRTAALFILRYGDGGIGSSDHRFDDMQRRGKDSAAFTSAVTATSPAAVIITLEAQMRPHKCVCVCVAAMRGWKNLGG